MVERREVGQPFGFDDRNPAMNSSESPGRKKPISSPVSAKTMSAANASPPWSSQLLDVEQGKHVGTLRSGCRRVHDRLALRLEKMIAPINTASAAAAMEKRAPSLLRRLMIAGRINSETRFITLIKGFSAGPAVSLNGSPTVSAITAAR